MTGMTPEQITEMRDQIADALLDMPGGVFPDETHRRHQNGGFAADCPICKGDVPAIADAMLAVVRDLIRLRDGGTTS